MTRSITLRARSSHRVVGRMTRDPDPISAWLRSTNPRSVRS